MPKSLGRLTSEQLKTKAAAQQQIREFQPQHQYLVCFDMDGHLLDSMTAKQVLVFHPIAMDYFGLRGIEPFYRLHAENHNLWTADRGCDRHEAKSMTLGSLLEDPVLAKTLMSTDLTAKLAVMKEAIDGYIKDKKTKGYPYSFDSLWEFASANPSKIMDTWVQWSRSCDHEFAWATIPIPPFPGVKQTLEFLADRADVWVVSKTPYNDICNWLEFHGIMQYVTGVAGKEMGDKGEHICLLKGGEYNDKAPKDQQVVRHGTRYIADRVIMGGDGTGDMDAVKANNGLFYPTAPGSEVAVWGSAIPAVFEPFFAANYSGRSEQEKIKAFMAAIRPRGFWKAADYQTAGDFIRMYAELDPVRRKLYGLQPGGKLVTAEKARKMLAA